VAEYSVRCTQHFDHRVSAWCKGCDKLHSDKQVYSDNQHLLCIRALVQVLGNSRCCMDPLGILHNTGILLCDSSQYNLHSRHNCKDPRISHSYMQEPGDTPRPRHTRALCILCRGLLGRRVDSSTLLGGYETRRVLQYHTG